MNDAKGDIIRKARRRLGLPEEEVCEAWQSQWRVLDANFFPTQGL